MVDRSDPSDYGESQRHRYLKRLSFDIPFVAGALIATFFLFACNSRKPEKTEAAFVDPQACYGCHEEQKKEWTGSHHDLAMKEATDKTVLGDFSDATFNYYGITSRFFNKEGGFFANTDGPDGKMADYEIRYTFGVIPLQQYLIELEGGRMQALDIAWDTRPKEEGGQRWFHIHPDDKITYDDILHWTGLYLNWNFMCAECHSTDLQKNYDLKTDTFKTTWHEINVGCQGCHGPGSNHVKWAKIAKGKAGKYDREDKKGLEVQLDAEDSRVQVEGCARCHSRRTIVSSEYRYGEPFMDHYVPATLREELYYPDGQILDEVYVYGSFLQSKKYKRGVRCSDCHDPHTAGLRAEGNALCVRCHGPSPPPEYKTLGQKEYDTSDHHFHKPGSAGSLCVECHMPATNYMVVDPRRDHSFLVPRPDLTLKLGTPNSCNSCHEKRSAGWAAGKVGQWYPKDGGGGKLEPYFAEVIAAGRAGKQEAGEKLAGLAGDTSRPGIIRATALDLLQRYGGHKTLEVIISALSDSDPLVRYAAVRSISAPIPKTAAPETQRHKLRLVAPLLKDPIRAVRTEAARVLTEVPRDLFDQAQRGAFDAALEEFVERQNAIAERPDGHLNLGMMYQNFGKFELAEDSYLTALRLEERFYPARFNLANLYNALGRNVEAEGQFREIIDRYPDNGEAHYSLGLLLAEMKRLEEAAGFLKTASDLMPDRVRVRYNYALALQHLGRSSEAEGEMLKAHKIDRSDPGIIQALAILYVQQRKWDEALTYARKLVELMPGDPGPGQLVEQIQREMSSKGDSR
jgi:predicted CXXCH cytochrome family protein